MDRYGSEFIYLSIIFLFTRMVFFDKFTIDCYYNMDGNGIKKKKTINLYDSQY